ncbi:MAG: mechanosensitive ion channel family protein [Flavobacteriales bacterium]|nr:mechanosensitive ion channel family protein [Flavobacteriales bacterium]
MKLVYLLRLQLDVVEDEKQNIDVDPGMAIERIDSWIDGIVRLAPNIIVAILVLVAFYFLARFAKRFVTRQSKKRGRENLGQVAGGFIRWIVLISGFVLAATIVIPTLKPGDIIAGLGVSSVAIGFAFKDILQNWLAGLLILLRQPFEVDDQIEVSGHEGTVMRIETRATIIRTYDNQRVVIPNSDIYTSAVKVKTANEIRRSQYDVGIGYADDIERAKEVIKKAVSQVEGVSQEKDVEALVWGLDASRVTLRVRWWSKSRRSDVVHINDRVITAVKHALDDASIDMPYETQVHLFHDQTEESDGDRSAQREGWPDEGEGTRPRWKAEKEKQEKQQKPNSDSDRSDRP